jgi:hypothetical protein
MEQPMMIPANTRFPFIVRVQGRNVGQPDNIRHLNCDSLASMDFQLKRAIANPNNHKVEVLAVLETWQRD